MKNITLTKKLPLLFLLCLLCLSGCGNDQQLEEYSQSISSFTTSITNITAQMEEIDTTSENAQTELIACLNAMKIQFEMLAAMDVPKEFASVETLADEASSYMNEAVALYTEVFSADQYLEEKADAAGQNYDRAMQRLSYISSLLQGEIPEGDNIVVTEEEILDFEPVSDVE